MSFSFVHWIRELILVVALLILALHHAGEAVAKAKEFFFERQVTEQSQLEHDE